MNKNATRCSQDESGWWLVVGSWKITILSNKMKYMIVFFTILLLTACNNEKKPIKFSDGENFMYVTSKFYSINGAKIGLTYKDLIKSDRDSVKSIIEIFETKKDFKRMWYNDKLKEPAPEERIRIHFDENLPYKAFHRVLTAIVIAGISEIEYVIEDDYKNPFKVPYFTVKRSPITESLFASIIRLEQKGVSDDSPNLRTLNESHRKMLLYDFNKCRWPKVSIHVKKKNDSLIYYTYIYESIFSHKNDPQKFLSEPELWNYIDSMGIKKQLESKACDKHIGFYPDSNILLKELVPTMRKIEEFRK